LVAPTLPYLQKPYSLVEPYVTKADEIGDSVLNMVDNKVPVVKTETKDIKDTAVGYAYYPYDKYSESKKYVFDTYGNEYKKCGGDGVLAGGKAVITSSLVVASDVLTMVSKFISQKKEEAKQVSKEKTSN